MELVDAGQTPYMAEQVVSIAYDLVLTIASFMDKYQDWKRTNVRYKTRTNFKVDFGLAFKETREH